MISKRASQDMKIWRAIVSNAPVVEIPVGRKYSFFWKEIRRLYKSKSKFKYVHVPLCEYSLDKPAVLAYSGGLESAVIHHLFPHVPTFDYRKDKNTAWTNPIEPALMIYGAGLGYHVTFYGQELMEGFNLRIKNYDVEACHYLAKIWEAYSGAVFVSPVVTQTKHDLFKIALRDGIKFYSCFSNHPQKKWCGKCYKCLLIDTLYRIEDKKSPIKLTVTFDDLVKRRLGKVNSCELSVLRNLFKKL